MSQPVVVLGGGISGLATAYYLTKIPAVKRIVLLDKKARLGGWIQSTRYPCGTVDEHGPHSIRTAGHQGANTLSLIDELGLGNEILPVYPKTLRGRLIFYKDDLVWLPGSLADMFMSRKPFNVPPIVSIAKDLVTPKQDNEDESLQSFFQRRFSKDFADYLINPMCRGICAGNSAEISVRSLLPAVFFAEKTHRSVVYGMMKAPSMPHTCELHTRSQKESWGAFSFKQGLQTLVDSLREKIENDRRVTVYENEDNIQLTQKGGDFTVRYAESSTPADHLFSCIPAKALSRMMSRIDSSFSLKLMQIPIAHIVSCTLEFEGNHLKHQAFGYLVPSSQPSRVLGMIFDSACFPQHDGQFTKKTRVTCLMGGHWFSSIFGDIKKVNPDVYTEAAREACELHLGIKEKPIRNLTNVLPNCIPQYQVGHFSVIEQLKGIISEKNYQMSLLGSSYEGLSVNDCIYNAKLAVDRYVDKNQLR